MLVIGLVVMLSVCGVAAYMAKSRDNTLNKPTTKPPVIPAHVICSVIMLATVLHL